MSASMLTIEILGLLLLTLLLVTGVSGRRSHVDLSKEMHRLDRGPSPFLPIDRLTGREVEQPVRPRHHRPASPSSLQSARPAQRKGMFASTNGAATPQGTNYEQG